jgi:predicted nuclease of predicted toxin-antitoxin system
VRLLADENCPHVLVRQLRERGHDVVWVREVQPGAGDEDVVARATRETRVLLTFDKDFGEIAYRTGVAAPSGVILLRISTPGPDAVAEVVMETLDKYPGWEGAFSVIEDTRVRRRQLS